MENHYARLRVYSANTAHCAPDWTVDFGSRQNWCDYDLWVMRGGKATMRTPEGEYALAAGGCFLLRGGEAYFGCADPADPPVVTFSHFDYLDASGRPLRPPKWLPPLYRILPEAELFGQLLDRLVESFRDAGEGDMRPEIWLAALLAELDRQDALPPAAGPLGEQAEVVARLCAEIREWPGREYPLPALAARLHVTPHHFGRLFKRLQGVMPGEFVIRARLESARIWLRNSGHSIGRIAELLGYRDIYFFSRQFRERIGVSPRAYREGRGGRDIISIPVN